LRATPQSQILSWIGIIGGASTLFSNVSAFLDLAGWVAVAIAIWREWTTAFWSFVLGWLPLNVQPWQAGVLSTSVFILAVAAGARLDNRKQPEYNSEERPWYLFWGYDVLPFFIVFMAHFWDIKTSSDKWIEAGERSLLEQGYPFLWMFFGLGPCLIIAFVIAMKRLNLFIDRMRFIVLGAVLLIIMNEIGKLNLNVSPSSS